MTAISRLPGTIDAVVAALKAVAGYSESVFDGPEPVAFVGDCIYIGYDGDPNGRWKMGDTQQDWAGTIGTSRRDELFDIICAVKADTASNDTKAARDAAYDLLGTVETTLRANPGLGFSSPYVAGVRPRETFMVPYEDGMSCRVTFTISVRTRV